MYMEPWEEQNAICIQLLWTGNTEVWALKGGEANNWNYPSEWLSGEL